MRYPFVQGLCHFHAVMRQSELTTVTITCFFSVLSTLLTLSLFVSHGYKYHKKYNFANCTHCFTFSLPLLAILSLLVFFSFVDTINIISGTKFVISDKTDVDRLKSFMEMPDFLFFIGDMVRANSIKFYALVN